MTKAELITALASIADDATVYIQIDTDIPVCTSDAATELWDIAEVGGPIDDGEETYATLVLAAELVVVR